MTESCLVLVLGPSTVTYSETDDSKSITGLLQTALSEAAPDVDWQCTARILFFSGNMVERARRLVREVKPDIAIYVSNSRQFDEDVVVGRILRRWPRLYPASQRWADRTKVMAGGMAVGSPTPRGWLFRLPRWLAAHTIGAEPLLSVDEASGYAEAVLDALVEIEDVGVVFYLAPTANASGRRSQQRIASFHEALSVYCDERRIPHNSRYTFLTAAGEVPRLSPDGRHADLRTRELDAAALSRMVLRLQAVAETHAAAASASRTV